MNTKTPVRILFVDDDETLVNSLSQYFSKVGHQPTVALTGNDGLKKFEQIRPDVVVLDLNMPDLSGLEILSNLRHHKAMVIMLTGMGDLENAVEAMRLGAENFLTKPVEMSHLLISVEKAAEKARLSRENVELKAKLSPSFKKMMIRIGVVIILALASAAIGLLIGSGGDTDPRTPDPVPVPIGLHVPGHA